MGKSDLDFVGYIGKMGRKRLNSDDEMNDLMNLPKKVIPFKDYSNSKKTKTV